MAKRGLECPTRIIAALVASESHVLWARDGDARVTKGHRVSRLTSTKILHARNRGSTNRVRSCRILSMAAPAKRINVTLDEEHASKLNRLARRTHVQEGTLARSLLSSALDDADPDAARITEILDAIPGAWERTQEGLAQAARGEGTPLDELAS